MPVFNFFGYDCEVVKRNYKNGAIALELIAADTENNTEKDTLPGEPICCATVCIPDIHLQSSHTCVKNNSENSGILEALEEARIVKSTGREVKLGYVTVPVVEVLI